MYGVAYYNIDRPVYPYTDARPCIKFREQLVCIERFNLMYEHEHKNRIRVYSRVAVSVNTTQCQGLVSHSYNIQGLSSRRGAVIFCVMDPDAWCISPPALLCSSLP